jgi:hypothetical protein
MFELKDTFGNWCKNSAIYSIYMCSSVDQRLGDSVSTQRDPRSDGKALKEFISREEGLSKLAPCRGESRLDMCANPSLLVAAVALLSNPFQLIVGFNYLLLVDLEHIDEQVLPRKAGQSQIPPSGRTVALVFGQRRRHAFDELPTQRNRHAVSGFWVISKHSIVFADFNIGESDTVSNLLVQYERGRGGGAAAAASVLCVQLRSFSWAHGGDGGGGRCGRC